MNWLNAHLLDISNNISAPWNEKIDYLYARQLNEWDMARNHYEQLATIEKRTVSFDDFRIDIQHNPTRARSTCADVSKKNIDQRPCFLCAQNLPKEQRGFSILNKYLLLINPYPIFDRHLTISDFSHLPQLIENRIIDLLSLSKELKGFTVFYNGPQCGASAPDHFHFQAAKSDIMPIDTEIIVLKSKLGKLIFQTDIIQIVEIYNYLRPAIILESDYREPIDHFFSKIYKQLPTEKTSGEPMMNLMANFVNNKYRLTIFPRQAQRPSCYYRRGTEQILVSPASVEMGGLIITPRIEDFKKLTEIELKQIFEEVCALPYLKL